MWNLPKIFSSGALFQAGSALTVHGITDPAVGVAGKIVDAGGNAVSTASAAADGAGRFSLTLTTPAASFDPYRIELSNGRDGYAMEDVLFGELWLASGQSNMEMYNRVMPGKQQAYAAVAAKKIRFFHVDYYPDAHLVGFPEEPYYDMAGWWIDADNADKLEDVSACALQWANDLYPILNREHPVPLGVLNACWGGTDIAQWFPRDAVDRDAAIRQRLEELGMYPHREHWNTDKERSLASQVTSKYNVKLAPLEGARVRGLLWYQGESDCDGHALHPMYEEFLRFFYGVCRDRFATDPTDFKMFSVLFYPWTYGESGECKRGFINDVFVKTAREDPDKFACIAIDDLSPVWAFDYRFHPIHPAHKYDVGARLARLTAAVVYGAAEQKSPATLLSCEKRDGKLVLRFGSVGSGLFIRGDRVKCLYVSDAAGRYFPADAVVTAPDTLTVESESVTDPCAAAYDIQSMEIGANLFAGEYAVLPFFTGDKWPEHIEAYPWYDTATAAIWVRGEVLEDYQDVFYRPLWQPLPESAVCPDTAFRRPDETASLRIIAEGDGDFGCYVRSYPYNRLDLQRYDRLTADLYNTEKMTAELVLETEDGEQTIPFAETADLGSGWHRFEARLDGLSEKEIRRMAFRFRLTDTRYRFVNMEHLRLH